VTRVVVTGIGAVSTWGWDSARLWEGLVSSRSGLGRAEGFDTRGQRTDVAGEVPAASDELAVAYCEWRHYSQADRFAVVAAVEACQQASLEGFTVGQTSRSETALQPDLGVFFGGSTAGMMECEEFLEQIHDRARRVQWGLLATQTLNCPGDAVARLVGACGPVQAVSSACASGGLAIGAALDALRSGEVEMALAGGADSLCRLTYTGFNSLRAVDVRPCRPFREDRAGLSLGEGSGFLFLETLAHAEARGQRPLAELVGAGASCDAHHMTAPHPRGEGAALAIERALEDARLKPADVSFVNAHGTGTPHNDAAESQALARVFGDRTPRLPVTSTKASVGHLLGSSGAIEAVATVQCLQASEVHAVPGPGGAEEGFAIDLVVDRPRRLQPSAADSTGRQRRTLAVSTSLGFGGANAAVVLSDWTQEALS
jgi:3-oxoacyl-[acyl-carrier-protein] synthase II